MTLHDFKKLACCKAAEKELELWGDLWATGDLTEEEKAAYNEAGAKAVEALQAVREKILAARGVK